MLADPDLLGLFRLDDQRICSGSCVRMICLIVAVMAAVSKTLCFQHIPGQIVQWYHLFQTMVERAGIEPTAPPILAVGDHTRPFHIERGRGNRAGLPALPAF